MFVGQCGSNNATCHEASIKEQDVEIDFFFLQFCRFQQNNSDFEVCVQGLLPIDPSHRSNFKV